MENQMIQKIEKCLEEFDKRTVMINQAGFILSQFYINKLMYKIQSDILNLRDETQNVYISINLNEVYQFEISASQLKLYMDNDIEIRISVRKQR